jgi:hypothetical protein
MFDNFVEENYHPSDRVYTHGESGNHIFIGDAQSALDLPLLAQNNIKTGTACGS